MSKCARACGRAQSDSDGKSPALGRAFLCRPAHGVVRLRRAAVVHRDREPLLRNVERQVLRAGGAGERRRLGPSRNALTRAVRCRERHNARTWPMTARPQRPIRETPTAGGAMAGELKRTGPKRVLSSARAFSLRGMSTHPAGEAAAATVRVAVRATGAAKGRRARGAGGKARWLEPSQADEATRGDAPTAHGRRAHRKLLAARAAKRRPAAARPGAAERSPDRTGAPRAAAGSSSAVPVIEGRL